MCFVVVYKKGLIFYKGMQIDDGKAAAEYAKVYGCNVRQWAMYGLNHFSELPDDTKAEIKSFIRSLR